MPYWSIAQPSLAFFLGDKPFFYNTSRGREVVFQLTFKGDPGPSGTTDAAQQGIFSVGTNWHSPWRSYIQTNYLRPWAFFVVLGDGSVSQYVIQQSGLSGDISENKFIYDDEIDEYILRFPSGS